MDDHSKREVLEIFNMNKKDGIARFIISNRPPTRQWFTIFRKMMTWYITWLINTLFMLWNVKGDEFYMCAKVWFSAIIFTEVIANKPFSRDKPLNYLSSDLTRKRTLRERLSKSLGYKAASRHAKQPTSHFCSRHLWGQGSCCSPLSHLALLGVLTSVASYRWQYGRKTQIYTNNICILEH